jgi:hypothetical protein
MSMNGSELTRSLSSTSSISSLINSDVSLSTKGDKKVTTEMGLVKKNKGENVIEVAVPTAGEHQRGV